MYICVYIWRVCCFPLSLTPFAILALSWDTDSSHATRAGYTLIGRGGA